MNDRPTTFRAADIAAGLDAGQSDEARAIEARALALRVLAKTPQQLTESDPALLIAAFGRALRKASLPELALLMTPDAPDSEACVRALHALYTAAIHEPARLLFRAAETLEAVQQETRSTLCELLEAAEYQRLSGREPLGTLIEELLAEAQSQSRFYSAGQIMEGLAKGLEWFLDDGDPDPGPGEEAERIEHARRFSFYFAFELAAERALREYHDGGHPEDVIERCPTCSAVAAPDPERGPDALRCFTCGPLAAAKGGAC